MPALGRGRIGAYAKVGAQLECLLGQLDIPLEPAKRLFQCFASESIDGPYRGSRRFSAINADGFPFQWSVASGQRSGGLRFVVDCGIPGTSIAARVQHSLARLSQMAQVLRIGSDLEALKRALQYLLPDLDLLEDTLMGLCFAIELLPEGAARVRIYINGEIGDTTSRYSRFEACLADEGRHGACQLLHRVQQEVGTRVVPAFVAIDVHGTGIGRMKLYFRPTDGSCAVVHAVAAIAGVDDPASSLAPLHEVFANGHNYPPEAVDFSLEFPAGQSNIGFKLDLNTRILAASDAEVDERVRSVYAALQFDDAQYRCVRDIVAGSPSTQQVRSILFIGLALRGGEQKLNVYFHPYPTRS